MPTPDPTPENVERVRELVRAAVASLDEQKQRDLVRYRELDARLHRLVTVYATDGAEAAAREAVGTTNDEYDLTGDCSATNDLSEFLDPEQEMFEQMSKQ